MRGPAPKRSEQRRRRNEPEAVKRSGGLETPDGATVAPDELGFPAHPLVVDLWSALRVSAEGRYFSAADWQRARIELFYLAALLKDGKTPGAMAWSVVQSGLSTLLVSPAEKRRVGIELKRVELDEDEDAAVAQIEEYRNRLAK